MKKPHHFYLLVLIVLFFVASAVANITFHLALIMIRKYGIFIPRDSPFVSPVVFILAVGLTLLLKICLDQQWDKAQKLD